MGTISIANQEAINNANNSFNWERAFAEVSVDKQVSKFYETILITLSNFSSNKFITIDDEGNQYFSGKIKNLLGDKRELCKVFAKIPKK